MKQIIESQLVGGKQDGYFTSVVVNLNSGQGHQTTIFEKYLFGRRFEI